MLYYYIFFAIIHIVKQRNGDVAQLARASGSYPAGRVFESHRRYQFDIIARIYELFSCSKIHSIINENMNKFIKNNSFIFNSFSTYGIIRIE